MRLVDWAAGPFSLLKNKHLAQLLAAQHLGQLYLENLLRWIQYDSPALMRLVDWAAGPFSLLKNEHLARVLAIQHSGPILP